MTEYLRWIERALKFKSEADFIMADTSGETIKEQALQALAALRSLLEGEAGEDEKKIGRILRLAKTGSLQLQADYDDALAAFSRLSAKAGLGEAEIREAKKEVLEELKTKFLTHRWFGDEKTIEFFNRIIEQLFAALKEAGKEKNAP